MKTKIILALDTDDLQKANQITKQMTNDIYAVKIGLELFLAHGIDGVKKIIQNDTRVFLDLKFNDIPNTMIAAILQILIDGVFMFTVHANVGKDALQFINEKLLDKVNKINIEKPLIAGVTLLTSITEETLGQFIPQITKNDYVSNLAKIALEAKLDALICSGQEIDMINEITSKKLKLVVPGIRMTDDPIDDQKRIFTPQQIANKNLDFIVLGRTVTSYPNPKERLLMIKEIIANAI